MKNIYFFLILLLLSNMVYSQNWTAQTSGTTRTLYDVFFANSTTGWTVGDYGTILKTTNGGTTWTAQNSGYPNSTLNDVFFLNENVGFACGYVNEQVLLKTTNGGATWTALNQPPNPNISAIHFLSENIGFAVGYGDVVNAGGAKIWKTTNGGINWTVATAHTGSMSHIHFSDNMNGWAVGKDGNNIGVLFKTNDGGANWTLLNFPNLPSANGVHSLGNSVFAVTNVGWVVRSNDGGNNFTVDEYLGFGHHHKVQIIDANTVMIAAVGKVAKTTNGGTTWTSETLTDAAEMYGIHFIDANNGWAVGRNGKIFKYEPTPTSGSVTANLVPNNIGGQWRRVGTTTWYNGGQSEANIPFGNYDIEFKDVFGYIKPANQAVTLSISQTTQNISATYSLLPQATSPTFSQNNGTFLSPVYVSMSSATPNAVIRYTIDGSVVTNTSPMYSQPIYINQTTTIKAKTYAQDFAESNESSVTINMDFGANQAPVVSGFYGEMNFNKLKIGFHVTDTENDPLTVLKVHVAKAGTNYSPSVVYDLIANNGNVNQTVGYKTIEIDVTLPQYASVFENNGYYELRVEAKDVATKQSVMLDQLYAISLPPVGAGDGTTLPNPPTDLIALPDSNVVYLSWQPSKNTMQYWIFRKEGNNPELKIGTVHQSAYSSDMGLIQWVDEDVEKGKNYTYWVKSVNNVTNPYLAYQNNEPLFDYTLVASSKESFFWFSEESNKVTVVLNPVGVSKRILAIFIKDEQGNPITDAYVSYKHTLLGQESAKIHTGYSTTRVFKKTLRGISNSTLLEGCFLQLLNPSPQDQRIFLTKIEKEGWEFEVKGAKMYTILPNRTISNSEIGTTTGQLAQVLTFTHIRNVGIALSVVGKKLPIAQVQNPNPLPTKTTVNTTQPVLHTPPHLSLVNSSINNGQTLSAGQSFPVNLWIKNDTRNNWSGVVKIFLNNEKIGSSEEVSVPIRNSSYPLIINCTLPLSKVGNHKIKVISYLGKTNNSFTVLKELDINISLPNSDPFCKAHGQFNEPIKEGILINFLGTTKFILEGAETIIPSTPDNKRLPTFLNELLELNDKADKLCDYVDKINKLDLQSNTPSTTAKLGLDLLGDLLSVISNENLGIFNSAFNGYYKAQIAVAKKAIDAIGRIASGVGKVFWEKIPTECIININIDNYDAKKDGYHKYIKTITGIRYTDDDGKLIQDPQYVYIYNYTPNNAGGIEISNMSDRFDIMIIEWTNGIKTVIPITENYIHFHQQRVMDITLEFPCSWYKPCPKISTQNNPDFPNKLVVKQIK